MNYAIEEMKNVERLATQFLYVHVTVSVDMSDVHVHVHVLVRLSSSTNKLCILSCYTPQPVQ